MALFRSPSDRKQIGIIAERMFNKNRPRLMSAYFQETERAFGYVFVDNRPDTPSDKQVLSHGHFLLYARSAPMPNRAKRLWDHGNVPHCQTSL